VAGIDMRKVILASASPWRRTLLERTGIPFTIAVSDYEEDHTLKLTPLELVQHLAAGKAETVALLHADAIVIGADTLVEFKGKPIGKAKDARDARRILGLLSNKTHPIHTGFCIIDTRSGKRRVGVETTLVTFRKLSKREIDAYVATGEPLNVAGAYAIQGGASSFASRIEGDFYNIVGLPLARIVEELKRFTAF
jgi:septum formation protein